jgi:colicin import membrane protein
MLNSVAFKAFLDRLFAPEWRACARKFMPILVWMFACVFARQLAFAQNVQASDALDLTSFSARYRDGSINSGEMADRALADGEKIRAVISTEFADDERGCYGKFFASSCMADAKERRRAALAQLRPIEVEAGRFKRNASAFAHDSEMEEKRFRTETQAPRRLIEQQENERATAKKLESQAVSIRSERQRQAASEWAAQQNAKRIEQHNLKLQGIKAKRVANAKKRADSIAGFGKKQREAKERQAKIASRKLERATKAAQRSIKAASKP